MGRARLGIFIGRFQPFHNGHLYALRYSLSKCDKLIIGIGSSRESGTKLNPLSSLERVQIIKAALKGTGIDMRKVRFLNIPDFRDNEAWFSYIIKKAPKIGIVFSNNRLVKRIFTSHKIKVIAPGWHKRQLLRASSIRKMIGSSAVKWHSRVPNGAVKEIALRREKIKLAKVALGKKKEGLSVVIGGTFAYLHSGHIALINKAFNVGNFVYIGLTTDEYVSTMKPRRITPTYFERKATLTKLLKGFRKGYRIEPLNDKYGPSTTGNFDAIVVSEETFPAALQINSIRKRNGLRPLRVFKIKYVLGFDGIPISTSRIANGEIDKEGNRI